MAGHPTRIDQNTASDSGSGNRQANVSVPTHQAGDLLIAAVHGRGNGHATPDQSGWTEIHGGLVRTTIRLRSWYRFATSSEPASYGFTQPGSGTNQAITISLTSWREVDSGDPIGTVITGSGGTTNMNLGTLSVSNDNSSVVGFWSGLHSFGSHTSPSGWSKDYDLSPNGTVRFSGHNRQDVSSNQGTGATQGVSVDWVGAAWAINPLSSVVIPQAVLVAVSPAATITRSMARHVFAAVSPALTLRRQVTRGIQALLGPDVTVSKRAVTALLVQAALVPAVTLAKSVTRRVSGTVAPAITLTRAVTRHTLVTLGPAASATKRATLRLQAGLGSAVTIGKQAGTSVLVQVAITPAVFVVRAVRKRVLSEVALVSTLGKAVSWTRTVVLDPGISVTKTVSAQVIAVLVSVSLFPVVSVTRVRQVLGRFVRAWSSDSRPTTAEFDETHQFTATLESQRTVIGKLLNIRQRFLGVLKDRRDTHGQ